MWALTPSVLFLAYLLGVISDCLSCRSHRLRRGHTADGDGNMGAQNAFRIFGPRIGISVGFIDFIKGAAVIAIARAVDMTVPGILLSGILAVAGHNWPVFLHFRGGRGAATTIGVLLLLVTLADANRGSGQPLGAA